MALTVTRDDYTVGECLEDQTGDGGILTFTFTESVVMVVITSVGEISRADPFGGVPSVTKGVYLDDGVPAYVPVWCKEVKIFAPIGAQIIVYGLSRD